MALKFFFQAQQRPPLRRVLALFSMLCLAALILPHGLPAQTGARGVSVLSGSEIFIQGAPDEDVTRTFMDLSDSFALKNQPAQSLLQLKQRAEGDLNAMERVLHARGYFKARTVARVRQEGEKGIVEFRIEAGPRFVLEDIEIFPEYDAAASETAAPSPEDLGLVPNDPYDAGAVLSAQKKLLHYYGERGHPFPEVTKREVLADFASDTVRIVFNIRPGPKAVFGKTSVEGLEQVHSDFVLGLMPWAPGSGYSLSLLEAARRTLLDTKLFVLVEMRPGTVLEEGNRLPMVVRVKERAPRTVAAGVNYSTDFGPGFNTGWSHRNILGEGETIEATLRVNEMRQGLESTLHKPRFYQQGQSLVVKSDLVKEHTDAFTSEWLDTSAMVERDLGYSLTAGAGLGYRYSNVVTRDSPESFGLFNTPVVAAWDTRDNLLDPSKGWVLSGAFTPYLDTLGNDAAFFKYTLAGSTYADLWRKRVVPAFRLRFAQIQGSRKENVPGDLLLHAGGGGSVRGYAYQLAGPLDGMTPLGGKSAVDMSLEIRLKLTDQFGLTPFLDGGRAYATEQPDPDKPFFWGAGMGLRYDTGFGPLRLDVAFPLDRRAEVDERFQIYVSLGQAF